MSFLSALLGNYGDDMARAFANKMDDAVVSGFRNKADDMARALVANKADDVVANKADDVVRAAANNYGNDAIRSAANNVDDALRGLGITQNAAVDPLDAAYAKLAQYKNANPEKLAQAMDTSSMLNDFDYAALLRKNEQAAINQLGADDFAALQNNIGGMLKNAPSEQAYVQARQRAIDYLSGNNSENVARASQQFVKPGQTIYRAANSPKGISWTTNRAIAEQERQNGAKILEYILQPDDKYISPQFIEMFSDSIAPQDQVLFNWDKLLRP